MLDPPRCRPAPRFPKARAKEHSEKGGQVEHLRQQGVSSGSGTMAAGEGDWVRRIAEAWALPSRRVGWVGGSRVGGAAVRAHARWGDQDFVTVAWRLRWRGGCACVGEVALRGPKRGRRTWHGMAWHGAVANAGVPRPRRFSLSLFLFPLAQHSTTTSAPPS
jgi:hypothetical protein